MPLAFHTAGTLGFEATKTVLVRLLAAILVCGWMANTLGRARVWSSWTSLLALPSDLRRVALGGAALAGSQALATAVSVAPALSLWGSYDRVQGLVTEAAWAVLAIAAALAGRDERSRRRIASVWTLASAPICLYGLAQWARLDPVAWLNQPGGVASTIGSPTGLGTYLAMMLPLTLSLAVDRIRQARDRAPGPGARRRRPKQRGFGFSPALAFSAALMAMQGVVLILADVRGALVGAVLGLGAVGASLTWSRRGLWRALTLGGVALAAVVVLVAAVLPWWAKGGWQASSARGVLDDPTRQRLLIWGATWRSAWEGWRALVGYGPETQALALERHFPPPLANELRDQRFDRAHDLVLDLLLTSGLIGLVAAGTFAGVLGWTIVRSARASPERRWLTVGLGGLAISNLGANLFAFDSAATATLFWLAIGLLGAPLLPPPSAARERRGARTPRRAASERRPARWRVTAYLGMSTLGLLATPALVGPLVADLHHSRALALRAGEAFAASLPEQHAAIEWLPHAAPYLVALGQTYQELARSAPSREARLPARFEDLAQMVPEGREGLLVAARLSFERAVAWAPLDPYTHLHLARSLALSSDIARDDAQRAALLDEASQEFQRAIALGPSRATFRDEAGRALLAAGHPDLAIEMFRQAEAIDRPTSERLALIGDAEARRGRLDEARRRYLDALALDDRSAPAEHGLASLDRAAGDLQQALLHAQRAARFQMRNWVYRRDLALIYRDLEMWPEALEEARAARRFAPAWEWERLSELVESVRR